jgi:hypothetical protein
MSADESAALEAELADMCRKALDAGFVVIALRCCCCGAHLDHLPTTWESKMVRPESLWTREPCVRCQLFYATHGEWPLG